MSEERLGVAHVGHTDALGGAELALLRMMQASPSWSPTVVLPPSPPGRVNGLADRTARIRGVEVDRVGVAQSPGASRMASNPLRAARVVAEAGKQLSALRRTPSLRRSDLVHANTSRAAAQVTLALARRRVPIVVHLRDVIEPASLGKIGYRLFTTVVLPRANGVIANSNHVLDSAAPFLSPACDRVVIPSPIGVARRKETVVRIDGSPLKVGMLARIDPWKGQELLIRAFAMCARHVNATLDLAGEPLFGKEDSLDRLRDLVVRLGIENRVRFLGHVEDIASLLDSWDIGVQASLRAEPLGQNVLQYLARGCAVLAADEGGPTEWVTDGTNGLLFRARDDRDLADKLLTLLEDSSLRRRVSTEAPVTPGLPEDASVMQQHGDFFEHVARRTRS